MSRRYRKDEEPWVADRRRASRATDHLPEKPASRQVMRHATRIADKDAWREHRKERKAWHRLERMRKIYDRRPKKKQMPPPLLNRLMEMAKDDLLT